MTTAYWCEHAWLGGGAGKAGVVPGVLIEVEGQRISSVVPNQLQPTSGTVETLAGLTIPGFANCHSHAFHRALRARTEALRGTFWTWRDAMYGVAARLEPDSYYELALATYEEMLLAGITAVGEFHYLHHRLDGRPYADSNAMGEALVSAALDAGLRICLLDTCYLSSGFGARPEGVQVRFSDGTAEEWADRAHALEVEYDDPRVQIGAAVHSVRAVHRRAFTIVAAALPDAPMHVHVSEQVAENDACLATYGRTPTQLLADEGLVTDRLSAVHATHLTEEDVELLGAAGVFVTFCPTTERDLADGIGPSRALAAAGAQLTLGSDSHAVIDMFEEMRAVELDERLATQQRGHWQPVELLAAATTTGHRSLGFADGGRLEPGAWADLVTVDLTSPRTAGAPAVAPAVAGAGAGAGVVGGLVEAAVFAATAADVTSVVSGGCRVVLDPAAVGKRLATAISGVVGGDSSAGDRP